MFICRPSITLLLIFDSHCNLEERDFCYLPCGCGSQDPQEPKCTEQKKFFFHCYKKNSLMNVASLMQGIRRNTKVLHFRYEINFFKSKNIYRKERTEQIVKTESTKQQDRCVSNNVTCSCLTCLLEVGSILSLFMVSRNLVLNIFLLNIV